MTARDERVEAIWNVIDFDSRLRIPDEMEQVSAALTAADALLTSDAAVERVVRELASQDGWAEEDWTDGFLHAAKRADYLRLARAAIAALLGEGNELLLDQEAKGPQAIHMCR